MDDRKRRRNIGESGFTLMEMLVVVGILGVLLSLGGRSTYQALSLRRTWQDESLAVRELRSAESWFAGDAMNASGTTLTDGAAPVGSVTLTWTDGLGGNHTADYTLSNGDMVRTFDGVPYAVAHRVQSAAFSLNNKTLIFQVGVTAEYGSIQNSTLHTYLRMLP